MTKDRHGTCLEYMEVQGTTPIVLVHGVGLDQNIWRAMLGDFWGTERLKKPLASRVSTLL
jgi:pimeloyl-ACP methyl ester carboxylesterase